MGTNALGWAAYKGLLAMVEFLLGRIFDLEAKNNVCSSLSCSLFLDIQLVVY
jgi:hypothetical protein